MMPLALDLISTLVMGSIFPVATTDRTIVPRSAVASFEASTPVDAPLSVPNPAAAAPTRTTRPMTMYQRFRDRLFPAAIWTFYVISGPEVHGRGKRLRYRCMWILQ